MQYCIATEQEFPYGDLTEQWLTAAPVDEFVMTYFGLAPEVLREWDADAAESKLYAPEQWVHRTGQSGRCAAGGRAAFGAMDGRRNLHAAAGIPLFPSGWRQA